MLALRCTWPVRHGSGLRRDHGSVDGPPDVAEPRTVPSRKQSSNNGASRTPRLWTQLAAKLLGSGTRSTNAVDTVVVCPPIPARSAARSTLPA